MAPDHDITVILHHAAAGDAREADRLMALIYDELKALAVGHARRESPDHTLSATALVHEAYMRLIDQTRVEWRDRNHFLAVGSQMIRRILVDHARAKQAAKRGGGRDRVELESAILSTPRACVDMLALHEALGELAGLNERQARIVELRYFGGLSIDETAHVVGLSPRMVDLEWSMARAWLKRALEGN